MHKINLTVAQNKILSKAGITCAEQLIRQIPNRYNDCRNIYSIGPNVINQTISVIGIMTKITSKTTTKLPMCIMDMIDGFTNVPFSVVWFNQPFMQKKYKFCVGQSFFIYGKLQYDPTFGYQIMNPQYFDTDLQKYRRLIPIYKQRKGIAASTYSKALTEAFSEDLVEPLSDSFRKAHNLPLSKNMGQQLMAPKNEDSLKFAMQYFMLEDMLYFSGHLYRRNITDNTCKIPIMPKTDLQKKIIANLPYALTEGQVNVIASVGQKLAQGNAVNALIQGDVSCGKTITAFLLLIQAAENGFQSAIMAPTVVLASQHYDELLKLLDGTGLKCAFLNGSLKKKEKDDILKKLASGEINIIVGTHSLTEDSVIFKNLGLIVIDEEQRFGVEKREKMREKAMYNPAYVSMSATPIPRTLASVIYGKNVDLFTIQSMPSGRKPVTTLYMKNKAIVENSLSLNPNAVITGKMFGNGIYFAPNSLKSWGYTSGGYWTREMSNPTRFMGLYATAYGEPLNVSSPGQYSESKIGHHGCVHAHAGSYLRNDEIIFYNESAMLLTYLVEFTA